MDIHSNLHPLNSSSRGPTTHLQQKQQQHSPSDSLGVWRVTLTRMKVDYIRPPCREPLGSRTHRSIPLGRAFNSILFVLFSCSKQGRQPGDSEATE